MKKEKKRRRKKEAAGGVDRVNKVLGNFVRPLEVPMGKGSVDAEVVFQPHFEMVQAIILFEPGLFLFGDGEKRWTATHTPNIKGPVAGYVGNGRVMTRLVEGLEGLGLITKRDAEAWIEWFRPQAEEYTKALAKRELVRKATELGYRLMAKK